MWSIGEKHSWYPKKINPKCLKKALTKRLTINKNKKREKRKTIHVVPSSSKPLTSPKQFLNRRRSIALGVNFQQTNLAKTPWKNEQLSRRERLDLWLAAKGKTPYVNKRRSYIPTPAKKTPSRQQQQQQITPKTSTDDSLDVDKLDLSRPVSTLIDDVSNQLLSLQENKTLTTKERLEKLDELKSQNEDIITLSDYWICRARLADGDVQRVINLLEQAYTVGAKPEEKIRDEICRFLQQLETEENSEVTKNPTKFAVTPGRRVHFAATDSPVEFKSSFIRFCIVESKAFKKRLDMQLKKKVMTPVRRSGRLRRSEIPQFLRDDKHRIIDSPTQVENDILDGKIGFVPSKVLNTPLNKGWLIDEEEDENNEDCVMELSFV